MSDTEPPPTLNAVSLPLAPPKHKVPDPGNTASKNIELKDDDIIALTRIALKVAVEENEAPVSETSGPSNRTKTAKAGVTIDMSRKKIRSLPDEFVDIVKRDVERLALSHNFLADFPAVFSACTSLRYLNASYNHIREFPLAICGLEALEILDIRRNKIKVLPPGIGALKQLKVLAVEHNKISELPLCLADMPLLQMLRIDSNPITFPPTEVLHKNDDDTEVVVTPSATAKEIADVRMTKRIKRFLKERQDAADNAVGDDELFFATLPAPPHFEFATYDLAAIPMIAAQRSSKTNSSRSSIASFYSRSSRASMHSLASTRSSVAGSRYSTASSSSRLSRISSGSTPAAYPITAIDGFEPELSAGTFPELQVQHSVTERQSNRTSSPQEIVFESYSSTGDDEYRHPYECIYCEVRFWSKQQWKWHQQGFHEKTLQYSCPSCTEVIWGSDIRSLDHSLHNGCDKMILDFDLGICLKQKTAWACGFCSRLFMTSNMYYDHVAQHFEGGKTKDEWRHSFVILGLLRRQIIWKVVEHFLEGLTRTFFFFWDEPIASLLRIDGWTDRAKLALQNELEFFSGTRPEAEALIQKVARESGLLHLYPTLLKPANLRLNINSNDDDGSLPRNLEPDAHLGHGHPSPAGMHKCQPVMEETADDRARTSAFREFSSMSLALAETKDEASLAGHATTGSVGMLTSQSIDNKNCIKGEPEAQSHKTPSSPGKQSTTYPRTPPEEDLIMGEFSSAMIEPELSDTSTKSWGTGSGRSGSGVEEDDDDDGSTDDNIRIRDIRDETMGALIDRIMEKVWILFESGFEAPPTDGPGHLSTATPSSVSATQTSGGQQSGKRPTKRSCDDFLKDDDGDHGASLPPSEMDQKEGGSLNRKFACQYRKHEPKAYTIHTHKVCALHAWSTIARLKEHLFRCHRQAPFCKRCWQIFSTPKQLEDHLLVEASDICHKTVGSPPAGITAEQYEKLKSRKKSSRNQSEEDRWRDIYRLLFPDEKSAPSPYFKYVEDSGPLSPGSRDLFEYRTFLSAELPGMVRSVLEQEAEKHLHPLEEFLTESLPRIIQECQEMAFRDFQRVKGGGANQGPILADAVDPSRVLDSTSEQRETIAAEAETDLGSSVGETDLIEESGLPDFLDRDGTLGEGYINVCSCTGQCICPGTEMQWLEGDFSTYDWT